jgi:hypothetical protein
MPELPYILREKSYSNLEALKVYNVTHCRLRTHLNLPSKVSVVWGRKETIPYKIADVVIWHIVQAGLIKREQKRRR